MREKQQASGEGNKVLSKAALKQQKVLFGRRKLAQISQTLPLAGLIGGALIFTISQAVLPVAFNPRLILWAGAFCLFGVGIGVFFGRYLNRFTSQESADETYEAGQEYRAFVEYSSDCLFQLDVAGSIL